MASTIGLPGIVLSVFVAACAALAAISTPAAAQGRPTSPPPAAAATPGSGMEKLSGVWVEGPGYNITYGGNYDACTQRCLAAAKCVMIEYYRPEKKCNLYDQMRPRKTGGSSDVGIRR